MTIYASSARNRLGARGLKLIAAVGIAVLSLLVLPTASAADTGDRAITVRVINSKNGRPLKNVSVALTGPAGGFLKNNDGKVLDGITNKLGEVTLELPPPVPDRVGVFYTGGGTCELLQCSSSETFAVVKIMKVGIVATNCSKAKAPYKRVATPGELVIFAKPYTGWQCVMQEIP